MRIKYSWGICSQYDAAYSGVIYNLHDDYTIEHKTTGITIKPSIYTKDLYQILEDSTLYATNYNTIWCEKFKTKADKILDATFKKALKTITYDQFFDVIKLAKYDMAKVIIDEINELRI
jgi:hypothetical protein